MHHRYIHTPMINGREHPELIPDSVAYRMWFSQVGHALDNEAKMPGQVQAVLSMTRLSEADQATLKRIVLTWQQQETPACLDVQRKNRGSQASA